LLRSANDTGDKENGNRGNSMKRLLLIALFVALSGSPVDAPCFDAIPAGTDSFWQLWEDEIGTESVPSEAEAIRQLREKGYYISN